METIDLKDIPELRAAKIAAARASLQMLDLVFEGLHFEDTGNECSAFYHLDGLKSAINSEFGEE